MTFREFDFFKSVRLQEADMQIELFSVLNILLLLGILFLTNSRFILSPGLTIALPVVQHLECRETMGMLTVQSENFIILEDNIVSLNTLQQEMKRFLCRKGIVNSAGKTMLVRFDKSVSIDTVVKICDVVKSVGYENIQIAALSQALMDKQK